MEEGIIILFSTGLDVFTVEIILVVFLGSLQDENMRVVKKSARDICFIIIVAFSCFGFSVQPSIFSDHHLRTLLMVLNTALGF